LFHFVSAKYSFASSDNDRQGVWPVTIFLSAHLLSLVHSERSRGISGI
jgi:hypothetical protein